MAEALASAGVGHNLSRASFLEFNTKHNEIERELAEVAETRRSLNRRRKDLRKAMGAAGVDLAMFDRVLLDVELIPEEREVQARSYQQMMEWRNAPVGFQPSIDLKTDDPGLQALSQYELHAIDGEGFDAGRGGDRADANPHRPGSESYQRWQSAWIRGQAAAVAATGGGSPSAAANGSTAPHANGSAGGGGSAATPEPPEAGPKRRGRPPGQGGGRRKGSKNQPKEASPGNGAEPAQEPAADEGPTVYKVEDMPENPSPEPEPPAAAA